MNTPILLSYLLIPTTKRLTFDIIYQHPKVIYMGDDDGNYPVFTATNGYQVISRSRMDIQTECLWLLGAKHQEEPRSGSMVFFCNDKRDKAHEAFQLALKEWAQKHNGSVQDLRPS